VTFLLSVIEFFLFFKGADDLLGFELYHTLKADFLLRKCKHYGDFFIKRGRIDIEY